LKPYLSPAEFRVFAHRGSSEAGATENTLDAFKFALEQGVGYVETDVQASSDGVAVLFHDSDLSRLTGIAKPVNQFTLDELRAIPLEASSQRIATLEEALTQFPNARLNLDLKTEDSIAPAIEVIQRLNAQNRVLVSSFSPKRRLRAINALPGVATSADAVTVLKIWASYTLGMRKRLAKLLSGLDAIQVPLGAGPIRFDSAKFIKTIQGFGTEVHFWTVNTIDEARRLKELGARGIVTDASKLVMTWLSKG
jgi:glycerophosphoryl diester phosphodiesterase